MSQTAMFLYGTLRVGESLSGLLPPKLSRYGATIAGRLHYSPHTYGYPVLLPAEGKDDRVQGELVWVDLEDPDVTYVMLMEVQSGYSATWARVELNGGGHVDALTFTWHPMDGAGPRIDSGDWTWRNEGQRYACANCEYTYGTRKEAEECAVDDDDQYDAYLASLTPDTDLSAAESLALQKEDR